MTFERKLKSSILGFNKKETIKCIEDISNEYNGVIDELRHKNSLFEKMTDELEQKAKQDEQTISELEKQINELIQADQQKTERLQALSEKLEQVTSTVKEKIAKEVDFRNKIQQIEQEKEEIEKRLLFELSKKGPNDVIDEVSQKLSELSTSIKAIKNVYINSANQTATDMDSIDHSLIRTKVYIEELKQNPVIGLKAEQEVKKELSNIDKILKIIKGK